MDLLVTTSQSIEDSETTVRAVLAGASAARDVSSTVHMKNVSFNVMYESIFIITQPGCRYKNL
jgi:hypothetical protein